LWRAAHALTATSLVLSLPRRRHRAREVLAGLTGAAGAAMVKFAVAQAGHTSTTAASTTPAPTKSHSDGYKSVSV
jgi:hypothetical protein